MSTAHSNEHNHKHHSDTCSCGHRHEHDHGESCSCGHEHTHHHDETCSCGHEHHNHGEGCSCTHERHAYEQTQRKSIRPATQDKPLVKRVYLLENLGCANCAAKMEAQIAALDGVAEASITFATKQLRIRAKNPDALLPEIRRICAGIESQVQVIVPAAEKPAHSHDHHGEERGELIQIALGALLFIAGVLLQHSGAGLLPTLAVCMIAYLILGGRILLEAARNIRSGQVFDENFLMSVATLGAFAIQEYAEAVGVMLFYRIGTSRARR